MLAVVKKLLKDLTQENGVYSIKKVGRLGLALAPVVAGGCMCSVFTYRGVAFPNHASDWWGFATGIVLITAGPAGAIWLHTNSSKFKEDPTP